MTTSCERFERWLDEGRPAAGGAEARAHSESCVRCAAALEAALELDTLLAAAPSPTPVGFTAGVMQRIAVARPAHAGLARRAEPVPAATSAFDWWVRAAADPGAALALVLAALLVWRGDAVVAFASRGFSALPGQAWLSGLAGAAAALAQTLEPGRTGAWGPIGIAVLMTLPWASWLLFRWSESLVRRAPVAGGSGVRVP